MSAKIPVAERFYSRYVIDAATGCWLWTGPLNADGYGPIKAHGRMTRAHRVAYTLHYGPVPAGKIICHTCNVRRCVNPQHLYAGTWNDNVQDRVRRGDAVSRGKPHPGESNHHAKLTVDNVREIRRRAELGEGQKALAKEFGVHSSSVNTLVHRKTWACVA